MNFFLYQTISDIFCNIPITFYFLLLWRRMFIIIIMLKEYNDDDDVGGICICNVDDGL